MAKDLPYFKFIISEWNDGDITLCSLEAQGLFINLCSLYWSQEGELLLSKSKRRFSGCNATAWDELINDGIIKVQGDNIVINFLDEQFEDRGKLSNTNSKNAKDGWKKRRINATALHPHSDPNKVVSNKEEKREEEKRREEITPATFDERFKQAFDAATMEAYALAFRTVDLPTELKLFRLKCDNDKATYYHRDSSGLRTAFQYQLKTARKLVPQKEEPVQVYKKGRAFGEGQ